MKKINPCTCDLHKDAKFIDSLKSKLTRTEFKKVKIIFQDKWDAKEHSSYLEMKLNDPWAGRKYRKALDDMHKFGWLDNLTYAELIAKVNKL